VSPAPYDPKRVEYVPVPLPRWLVRRIRLLAEREGVTTRRKIADYVYRGVEEEA